jgi:hypothetical protein
MISAPSSQGEKMFTEFEVIMTALDAQIQDAPAYFTARNLLRQRKANGEDTSEFSTLRQDALETLGLASEGRTQAMIDFGRLS